MPILKKSKVKESQSSSQLESKSVQTMLLKLKKELRPSSEFPDSLVLFMKKVQDGLKNMGIKAKVMLGGSLAKGTYMKDSYDADIFVRFSSEYSDSQMSKFLEDVLKKLTVTYVKVHGSREYFQVKSGNSGVTFEMVPVLDVVNATQARNVADMSPLHVDYFIKKVGDSQELRDQIRLTKAFLKSARVYGAESHIKGFSGHVVDLLIINYGSFTNLIEKAAYWKKKTVIDIEKHHDDVLFSLNKSKTESPLIIVDPVQKGRNAAAAISEESYKIFIKKCKDFLKEPREEFFKKPDFQDILNAAKSKLSKKNNFITLNVSPLEGKDDVSGSKILKIKEYVETKLKEDDFEISWSDWEFDEKLAVISIAILKKKMSSEKIIEGPPLLMKNHAEKFKNKHVSAFVKDGKLYSNEKRKYLEPEFLIKDLIKDKYVISRCSRIEIAK